MTNTIPNVPRELLDRASNLAFQTQHYPLHEELRALLSAPSPAGVDGLEALAWHHFGDRTKLLCALGKERGIPGGYTDEFTQPLCRLSAAQAIIDGLRGEVDQLQSMLATVSKAGIRVRTDRDQQAQRIGELEGLLRSCLPALSDGGCAALANRIDAACLPARRGSDG